MAIESTKFSWQDHRGGLLDKPGKSRDFYHTCYTLSGLALAQIFASPGLLNTSVLGSFHLKTLYLLLLFLFDFRSPFQLSRANPPGVQHWNGVGGECCQIFRPPPSAFDLSKEAAKEIQESSKKAAKEIDTLSDSN